MVEGPIISTQDYILTGDEAAQVFSGALFRWIDYVFLLVCIMAVFVISLGTSFGSDDPPQAFGLGLGFIIFGLPSLAYAAHPFRRMRQMRRNPNKLRGLADALTQRYEFDGLFATATISDGQSSRNKLTDYKFYVVAGDMLFLYSGQKRFVVIPLRAFAAPADAERVYAMLDTQGVERRHKHPKGLFA